MKRIPDKLIHDNRRYISLRIAARVSGYHRDYLGQVIRAKELEAIRLGKSYYVTEEEFLQFVSRRHRRPVESLLRLLEADAPALPRMSTVLMDDYGVVMPVATHVPAFAWNDRATQKRTASSAESNSRWGAFLRDEAAQTRRSVSRTRSLTRGIMPLEIILQEAKMNAINGRKTGQDGGR